MVSISMLAATSTAKPAGPIASRTRSRASLAELHAAARSGDVNRVRKLLQAGVAVDGTMDLQGTTALHLAAAAGHSDVAQELLTAGADMTARHELYGTPLLVALFGTAAARDSSSAAAQVAIAAVLLKAGANIFEPVAHPGYVVAHHVMLQGNIAMLQRLLAAGCNVNQQNASGATLLHSAAGGGNEEAVRMLLAHGAAVDVPDSEGWTALFLAATRKHTTVVQQLLTAGAAATAVCKSGRTILHSVSCNQCAAVPSTAGAQPGLAVLRTPQWLRDTMQLLISSGADVKACDPTGLTPLHGAALSGSTAAAGLLLEYGADVNAVNNTGMSCLGAAATAGHADVVQMLLDAGADTVDALNDAIYRRHMHIIKLLLQHKGHPPSLDKVGKGFSFALLWPQPASCQPRMADIGSIPATLLLHFCLLAQKQQALSPSAAVSYLFSRPIFAAFRQDRPALSLALLSTWNEHCAAADAACSNLAAQERDLATVKAAAQQAYQQLAAADKAANSAPQLSAMPAAATAVVTSAAARQDGPTALAAVKPATAPRRSAWISKRVAATAAVLKYAAAKRRAR